MKKKYTMKMAYLIAAIIIMVMVLIQFLILTLNNIREAKSTINAYLLQAETILVKNAQEEDVLMASIKEDYTVLAKAVSYYLDHNPEAVYDADELQTICSLMSIDEIHIFDESGTLVFGTVPESIGFTFDSGDQIRYFKPMLSDKSLTMCQDITPNTVAGKPMVYAITWNESGTQMVQIGIEPVRFLEELKANEIQTTVDDIVLDEHMSVLVADASSQKVVGAKDKEYLEKPLSEVTDIDPESADKNFFYQAKLVKESDYYFCGTNQTEDYLICIFQSHSYYIGRTIESILVVFLYLLAAFAFILITMKRLISTRKANDEHMHVFESMSEIYYSLHLLDLKKNTAVVYSSRNQVKEVFNESKSVKADEIMSEIMKATMSDEYLQRGQEFTDITTLAERMRDKKIISMELLGRNVGWIRMSFITVKAEGGLPVKVIVATQIIDEEKKMAESLYEKSHVDELTRCFNRRAYNSDLHLYQECKKDFACISFDVNGLKTVNDELGHEAGDELICGAAECMMNSFSQRGKIYRVGGDEFVGLIYADGDLMKALCDDFDRQIGSWHGKLVKSISVSYGYVLSGEAEGKSMAEIASLADKRMYESKSNHYRQAGIDRRRTGRNV